MNNFKQRIVEAISAWNKKKDNLKRMKKSFDRGSFFEITNKDRAILSETNPEDCLVFLGLEKKNIVFILVDNITAKTPLTDMTDKQLEKVLIKEYKEDFDIEANDFIATQKSGNITVEEALKRSLRWAVYKESWLKDVIDGPNNEYGVFNQMAIPMESICDCDSVVVLGLKENSNRKPGESRYLADALVWSAKSQIQENHGIMAMGRNDSPVDDTVDDFTRVSPPYPGSHITEINFAKNSKSFV